MPPVEAPLDRALLDESAEFGLDDLRELIDLYLAQADEIMGELGTAVKTGGASDVDELAHKLAGSSAVCGVAAMVEPLRTLEKLGREDDLAGADQILAEATARLALCRRLLADYLAEKSCRSGG
jgi:HPt (histidine-containing phosphotransfer) domain-containing protein